MGGRNEELLIKALNLMSLAVLTGYMTVEYLVPFLKKKNWLGFGGSTNAILEKLGMKGLKLSSYEAELLQGVMLPEEVDYTFADIGGLEEQKRELIKNLALRTNLSNSSLEKLVQAPSGVLLYGPPGCGKTILAKALAHHSGMRFLRIQLSQILDKWVGESEKYIQAVFSLARKLAPTIVFLDEVEALMRQRSSGEREWSGMVKSQLLALWGECDGEVVVLGATNRREDIDEAFLRRMPLQIFIGLPNLEARMSIFQAILNHSFNNNEDDFWDVLGEETEGFNGSDIREACRRAALECLEDAREEINLEDLLNAIMQIKKTSKIYL